MVGDFEDDEKKMVEKVVSLMDSRLTAGSLINFIAVVVN